MRVESIKLDNREVLRFAVKPADGDPFETTKESLRSPESPDIRRIPTTIPEKRVLWLIYQMRQLKAQQTQSLYPLVQEELLVLHEILWHLPFTVMFHLVKAGILLKKFKKLNNKALPCVSCMLGQAHRKPRRFKKTKDGTSTTL